MQLTDQWRKRLEVYMYADDIGSHFEHLLCCDIKDQARCAHLARLHR